MNKFSQTSPSAGRVSQDLDVNSNTDIRGRLKDFATNDDVSGNKTDGNPSSSNEIYQFPDSSGEGPLATGSPKANRSPGNNLKDSVSPKYRSDNTGPGKSRSASGLATNIPSEESNRSSQETEVRRPDVYETNRSTNNERNTTRVNRRYPSSAEINMPLAGASFSPRISQDFSNMAIRGASFSPRISQDISNMAIRGALPASQLRVRDFHRRDQLSDISPETSSSSPDDQSPNSSNQEFTLEELSKSKHQSPPTSDSDDNEEPIVFKSGTEMCKLTPFVCALREDKLGTHCSFCFKKLTGVNRLCRGCRRLSYCNKTCKDSDWVIHQRECRHMDQMRHDEHLRCVARLYWKLTTANGPQEACEIEGKIYKYRNLTYDHRIFESKEFMTKLDAQYCLLETLKGWTLPRADFELMFARVTKHLMAISDIEDDLGLGMFLGLAAFPHSCVPRTNVAFVGNVMSIFARKNIKAASKVTLRFVDVFKPEETHLEDLVPINGGKCNCDSFGEKKYEAMSTTGNGGMESDYMKNILVLLQDLKRGAVPEDLLRKLEGMSTYLGCYNRNLVQIWAEAAACYRRLCRCEEIYCLEVLVEIFERILGACDTKTINAMYQLALVQHSNGNLKDCVINSEMAAERSRQAYGAHDISDTIYKYYEGQKKCPEYYCRVYFHARQ